VLSSNNPQKRNGVNTVWLDPWYGGGPTVYFPDEKGNYPNHEGHPGNYANFLLLYAQDKNENMKKMPNQACGVFSDGNNSIPKNYNWPSRIRK
jgi:hypothetical protein